MKMTAWMLVLFTVFSVGCSRTKAAKDVSQETPQIEVSDTDEFTEAEPLEAASPAMASDIPPTPVDAPVDVGYVEDAAPVITNAEAIKPETSGEYVVEKNETLMMIAFKLYGDYGKWREIARKNAGILKGRQVRAGMRLTYDPPAVPFTWSPEGNPYLIRTGDTLGGISGSVYGTTKKWKYIWDNNKPLIKDPNRIFAGFTLYWLELGKVAKATF